jgi:hypothetical protein
MKILDLPRYTQSVNAEDFLNIYNTDKKNIKSVTYVPHKKGARSLRGRFLVRFRTPVSL